MIHHMVNFLIIFKINYNNINYNLPTFQIKVFSTIKTQAFKKNKLIN